MLQSPELEKKIYITYVNQNRYSYSSHDYNLPSRFISEVEDGLIEPIKISRKYRENVKSKNLNHDFNEFNQEGNFDNFSQEDNSNYFRVGQKVNHMKFGNGVILSYTGKKEDLKLHINFEHYGKKWLVLSYAQLDFL